MRRKTYDILTVINMLLKDTGIRVNLSGTRDSYEALEKQREQESKLGIARACDQLSPMRIAVR